MSCPECGSEGSGNYCAQCGTPLAREELRCGECGAPVEEGARYCTRCGAPAEAAAGKPPSAYLPWILSGLALVTFAVAITLFVQDRAVPREGDRPVTGGTGGGPPGGAAEAPARGRAAGGVTGGSGEAGDGAMPTARELAEMGPREAADRLFDRAMREEAAGEAERARFFARMGRQAYDRVPEAELDPDARFHRGLLALIEGDAAAARSEAEELLSGDRDHLLGLLLAARAAGGAEEREEYRRRFLEAREAADLSARPEYEAHRALIDSAAAAIRR